MGEGPCEASGPAAVVSCDSSGSTADTRTSSRRSSTIDHPGWPAADQSASALLRQSVSSCVASGCCATTSDTETTCSVPRSLRCNSPTGRLTRTAPADAANSRPTARTPERAAGATHARLATSSPTTQLVSVPRSSCHLCLWRPIMCSSLSIASTLPASSPTQPTSSRSCPTVSTQCTGLPGRWRCASARRRAAAAPMWRSRITRSRSCGNSGLANSCIARCVLTVKGSDIRSAIWGCPEAGAADATRRSTSGPPLGLALLLGVWMSGSRTRPPTGSRTIANARLDPPSRSSSSRGEASAPSAASASASDGCGASSACSDTHTVTSAAVVWTWLGDNPASPTAISSRKRSASQRALSGVCSA
mmetsp:Transcript_37673/g.111485  ORF Transcript_37673/g.111485 Transcript_37673/m.111485 type:complete len:362 (+) Transcript_37673:2872-3957(+)